VGDVLPGLIHGHGLTPTRDFGVGLRIVRETVGKGNPDILALPRFFEAPRPVLNVP
jgi:hypothetical protein